MNTPDAKQYNVRLPRLTQQQLDELAAQTGLTTTQIVILSIDRMHDQLVVQVERERKRCSYEIAV